MPETEKELLGLWIQEKKFTEEDLDSYTYPDLQDKTGKACESLGRIASMEITEPGLYRFELTLHRITGE